MYDPTVTPPRTLKQLLAYVLMYGFFVALGTSVLLLILLLFIWPQWRVNNLFVETEGLVVDQREVLGEGGSSRQVLLRYSAHGVDVEHWNRSVTLVGDAGQLQQRIRALAIGDRCPVWYDPARPEVVVVERGYGIHWMLYPFIAGSGFFLLYGVGKIVVGVLKFPARRVRQ
jgi:hypothetical protein